MLKQKHCRAFSIVVIFLLFWSVGTLIVAEDIVYIDSYSVTSSSNKPMFMLRFYWNTEERYDQQLTATEKKEIAFSLRYWADVLSTDSCNTGFIPIIVFNNRTDNAGNAFGSSEILTNNNTALAEAVINGNYNADDEKTFIVIGDDWDRIPHSSQLPFAGTASGCLFDTTIHEMTHALGIFSNQTEGERATEPTAFDSHLWSYWTWNSNSSKWELPNTLSPDGGIQLTASSIPYTDTISEQEDDAVIVGFRQESGVYFKGNNVKDVLTIGNDVAVVQPGYQSIPDSPAGTLPVNGYEDRIELSHIELAHSMMSHQSWRNYMIMMEAELAVLQDIGYNIDRRNWYGFSIYNSGLTHTNNNPYYLRRYNEAADTWEFVTGEPNTALMGVGLHVYGSDNTITQAAPLLADGEAAIGIRNDGSGNTITVNTTVTANGEYGTGILMSYGVNNNLTIESGASVRATGTDGVAVRFDFGHNALGDKLQYRGSYMLCLQGEKLNLSNYTFGEGHRLNLLGPLVDTFTVRGALNGTTCAVYIADNAYVKIIDFKDGAAVTGAIISNWNPYNPLINEDNQGKTTAINVNASSLTVNGAIQGPQSLAMTINTGKGLTVTGPVDVLSLNNAGTFIAQDKAIQVNGTFTNQSTGTVTLRLMGGGLTPLSAKSIDIQGGTLSVFPVHGTFYRTGALPLQFTQDGTPVAAAGFGNYTVTGTEVLAASPTLKSMSITSDSGSGAAVAVERYENAYSRFASGSSGASGAGRALDKIAAVAEDNSAQNASRSVSSAEARTVSAASAGITSLLSTLDWSSQDGSDITAALERLTPGAYNAHVRAQLGRQQHISDVITARMHALKGSRLYYPAATPQCITGSHDVWVEPLVTHDRQQGDGSSNATTGGLIAGYEHWFSPRLNGSIHLGGFTSRDTIGGVHDARADAATAVAGAGVMYELPQVDGLYLFGHSTAGYAHSTLKRDVTAGSKTFSAEGTANSLMLSNTIGAGFDFELTNAVSWGPDLVLDCNLLYRFAMSESSSPVSLELNSQTYLSLPATLGVHASYCTSAGTNRLIIASLAAGYRRELTGGTVKTTAAFTGYGDYTFTTEDTLTASNSFVLNASSRLIIGRRFWTQLSLGGQFGSKRQAYTGGIKLGWKL